MISEGKFKIFIICITFATTFLAKWYPIDQILNDVFAYCTKNADISLELSAHIVGQYDSNMSLDFEAIVYHIHHKLRTIPKGSDCWKNIHVLKEIELGSNGLTCRVFSSGFITEGPVTISIRHRIERVSTKEERTKNHTYWTVTLAVPDRYGMQAIDDFIESCEQDLDTRMRQRKHQTLFETQLAVNSGVSSIFYHQSRFVTTKSFDNLYFPNKELLLRKLDAFENDEDGYARLGKPYKFYMMFHGLHGCAKTSVIKAIAKMTGKHVILMRLECFKDIIELCNSISNFAKNHRLDYKKCMFVIEEFDCFEQISRDSDKKGDETTVVSSAGSEAKSSNKKATEYQLKKADEAKAKIALGKMLNTFDGIKELHGCTAIFTTNKPEVFDPALVRPGRIELMRFGKLGAKEIAEYWKLSYREDIPESLASRLVGRKDLITLADLSLILETGKYAARVKLDELL